VAVIPELVMLGLSCVVMPTDIEASGRWRGGERDSNGGQVVPDGRKRSPARRRSPAGKKLDAR
jgi:hypothetical protein